MQPISRERCQESSHDPIGSIPLSNWDLVGDYNNQRDINFGNANLAQTITPPTGYHGFGGGNSGSATGSSKGNGKGKGDGKSPSKPPCAQREAKLLARVAIAQYEYAQDFGSYSPPSYEQKPEIKEVAGAAGTAVGIADTLFSGAGYKGSGTGALDAVTFVIPYSNAVKDAVYQGIHGTPASYVDALGEVVRQGAVFTGSSWIGIQMMETPNPLTILGGAAIVVGGVGVDAFNRIQDIKFAKQEQQADALQRDVNQQNFINGLANLKSDIISYNRDCGGK